MRLTTDAATPAATEDFIRAQFEAWGKVVKKIGILPQ